MQRLGQSNARLQEISKRRFLEENSTQDYDDRSGDSFHSEDYLFLGECHYSSDDYWSVNVTIGGSNSVNFKVDSGADVSIINFRTYNSLEPKPKIFKSKKKLLTLNGELKYVGCSNINY